MAEINERVTADVGASFQLRVGVNSGEVLAGKVGDGYTVIGDPVNVASRLQSAAKPGTVIVGEITHRLTRAAIEYVELEPLTLKGKAEPVPAWEAVRAVVRGRAQRTSRDSSPLIGREDETALMLSLFERVSAESRPHLVTVIAEAGVGKSRMLRELAARAGALDPRPAVRIGGCPAYGAGLAYWALGEIVRGSFDIVDSDDAETAWRKLESGIAELAEGVETGEAPERLAEIVGRAVGIERPNGGSPAAADGEDASQIRDRLFAAVRVLVEASSRSQPLILAIEDIHWADEGMLDLIEYLARSGQGRVLIVCLARDELLDRRPGWGGGKMNATTIALEPLAEKDATRPRPRADARRGAGRGRRAPGREALRRQPAVRRGDRQPARRGGRARHRVAARHRPRAARGAPRRALAPRAPRPPARVGGRRALLGRIARRGRP